MKEVDRIDDDSIYLETRDMIRLGNQAAALARQENKAHGLPNIISRNDKVYYELPDGTITDVRPEILNFELDKGQ